MKTTPSRVLVIDDDPDVRRLIRDLVAYLGYDVEEALSAAVGIRLMNRRSFDLVLTDLSMPAMNGWDVVEVARRKIPAIDVIMITGSAVGSDTERASREGVTILNKPVRFQPLKRAVQHALAGRAARLAPSPDGQSGS